MTKTKLTKLIKEKEREFIQVVGMQPRYNSISTTKGRLVFTDELQVHNHQTSIALIEEIIKMVEEKSKIMTWVNCRVHDLTTPIKVLDKCPECYFEANEREVLFYNYALSDIKKELQKTLEELK